MAWYTGNNNKPYLSGTLQTILSTPNVAPQTIASPSDIVGTFLEMGLDGLWTGASVGTMPKATADALYASGALASVAVGTPYRDTAGASYAYGGAGVGWAPERRPLSKTLRVAGLGDSLTYYGGGIALLACMQSSWRMRYVCNGGGPGDTSAVAIGRLPAILSTYTPDVVVIGLGTNDGKTGVSDTTFYANIKQAISLVRAAGATPVLVTCPPCGASQSAILAKNVVLQNIAWEERILLSHRWEQLNDGTFSFLPGSTIEADGASATHPKTKFLVSEGAGLVSDMEKFGILTATRPTYYSYANGETTNKFTNGMFLTDTGADGLANGVTAIGSIAASLETATGVVGKRQVATLSANGSASGLRVSPTFANGVRTLVKTKVTVTCTSGELKYQTSSPQNGAMEPYKHYTYPLGIPSGQTVALEFFQEIVSPYGTGAGNVTWFDESSGGSGAIKIESLSVVETMIG